MDLIDTPFLLFLLKSLRNLCYASASTIKVSLFTNMLMNKIGISSAGVCYHVYMKDLTDRGYKLTSRSLTYLHCQLSVRVVVSRLETCSPFNADDRLTCHTCIMQRI